MGIARGLRESTGGRRTEPAYFVFFEWGETVRRGYPRGSAIAPLDLEGLKEMGRSTDILPAFLAGEVLG